MTPQLGVRRLVTLAILIAVATGLHVVEGLFPPLPLPGARLGLANAATLLTLRILGFGAGFQVSLVRSILGGLLGGTLFGPGFLMGFAGAVSSALVMGLVALVRPGKASNIFVSVMGAITHSAAQIAVAAALLHHAGIWRYWPILTVISSVTGFFVGVVTDKTMPLIKRWELG